MLAALPGCVTTHYASQNSAEEVSRCIAAGWRTVSSVGSRVEMPVTLTREEDYFLVDVVMLRDFPTGTPVHSIWAKVRPSPGGAPAGSTTEYRRNFQIWHEKIDDVVSACQ